MKLTVDIMALTEKNELVLIKRCKQPYMDKLVLPGGHYEVRDKSLAQAAARELREEVGIKVDPKKLTLLTTLDNPGRDPRPEQRISTVFFIKISARQLKDLKAGSDAEAVVLKDLGSLNPDQIGFDHFLAIEEIKKLKHGYLPQ